MNTKLIPYVLIAIITLATIGISIAILNQPTQTPTITTNEQPKFSTQSTGSTGSGDVLLDLTPRGIENNKFIVDYAANTHSVTLSEYDLAQQTVLTYEGKELSASSATPMSGHHVQGTLSFALDTEPKEFIITITGVPGVEQRVYTWGNTQ